MTTFYLDFEGGNDSNDGTSFANRWLTMTSGATAARIAPGDTIRIKSSPAPTSLGMTALWTNKSAAITLNSALTKTASDCNSSWTASANVTHSANTTNHREGASCRSLAIAAGFTTGKVGYVGLGAANDFSGYQQITLWFRTSTTLAASVLSIRLCSDTTGDTTVDTFLLPQIFTANSWIPVVVDKGSALGASIQSVALYAESDPGTVTVLLDNIEACKASSSADSLTLLSLISKNADDGYGGLLWWPIRSIVGTAVILETNTCNAALTGGNPGFYGTTETVTTYKREPVKLTAPSLLSITDQGTSGNQIVFSGGWNRTDMSTQDDVTYVDSRQMPASSGPNGNKSYITLEKIRSVGGATGDSIASSTAWVMNDVQVIISSLTVSVWLVRNSDTTGGLLILGGPPQGLVSSSTFRYLFSNKLNLIFYSVPGTAFDKAFSGCTGSIKVYNCRLASSPACDISASNCHFSLIEIKDSSTGVGIYAMNIRGWMQSPIDRLELNNPDVNYNVGMGLGASDPDIVVFIDMEIRSGYSLGASTNDFQIQGSIAAGFVKIYARNFEVIGDSALAKNAEIYFYNYDNVAGDHRIFQSNPDTGVHATHKSETTIRHTASGLAWKMDTGNGDSTELNPFYIRLGPIWCDANVVTTVSLWVRRASTTINGRLFIEGNQLTGISEQSDNASAAIDTWEELSLTFTPTEAGVVFVQAQLWGGNASTSMYIDDLSVTQTGTAPDFKTLDYSAYGGPFLGMSAQSSGSSSNIIVNKIINNFIVNEGDI